MEAHSGAGWGTNSGPLEPNFEPVEAHSGLLEAHSFFMFN